MAYQIWLNKKRSLGRQQNVIQKRILETQQNVTTFLQFFSFPAVVGLNFILLFYFFTSTVFSQQILGEKLLLVLKLCIKNKQTKRQHKKIVCETVNFGSPNLTILKKKSKNSTEYHNIFTIPSFLGFRFSFIWEKCYVHNIFRTNSIW